VSDFETLLLAATLADRKVPAQEYYSFQIAAVPVASRNGNSLDNGAITRLHASREMALDTVGATFVEGVRH
jgi:hypothetical protein